MHKNFNCTTENRIDKVQSNGLIDKKWIKLLKVVVRESSKHKKQNSNFAKMGREQDNKNQLWIRKVNT